MRTLFRLSLALCFLCAVSHAESITLYNIGNDELFTGPNIDGAGVVEGELIHAGCGSAQCYAEYSNGQAIYYANVAPSGYVADNGTPCTAPNLNGAGDAVCNNGFEVYDLNRQIWEIFPNGDPLGVYITGGSADIVRLNSSGDFLLVDADKITTYQVIVSSTPEPSSFALFATGLLTAVGAARRRNASCPTSRICDDINPRLHTPR